MNKTYDLTVTAPEEFAEACAQVLFRTVKEKPDAVIGLSTGRTTGDIHRRFAALIKEHGIDVSHLTIFGLDEVTGVSRDYKDGEALYSQQKQDQELTVAQTMNSLLSNSD